MKRGTKDGQGRTEDVECERMESCEAEGYRTTQKRNGTKSARPKASETHPTSRRQPKRRRIQCERSQSEGVEGDRNETEESKANERKVAGLNVSEMVPKELKAHERRRKV
jgi:hypothetical protein